MKQGKVKLPHPRPCRSCPYRRDAPSGVWSSGEYLKLTKYDGETMEQLPGLFMCHQDNCALCSGWVHVHDMNHNLALRLAVMQGHLTGEQAEFLLDYTSPVPMFSSGLEAFEHGIRELRDPSPEAVALIEKITRRREEDAKRQQRKDKDPQRVADRLRSSEVRRRSPRHDPKLD